MALETARSLVSQSPRQDLRACPGSGIVLECTDRGALVKIRRDDLSLLRGIRPGTLFHHLVDRESLDKAFAFLTEVQQRKSAFGWDLKLSLACQPTTLCWGGFLQDGLLRIFGTKSRGGLLRFSRGFMDQGLILTVNQTIREQIGLAPVQDEPEVALQEKLRSANNQLFMLQRVLARKKATLKRVSAQIRSTRHGVQTFPKLVPICSSCKRIRDDGDNWVQVEAYFKNLAGVEFTHSICPECAQTLYPGLHLKK